MFRKAKVIQDAKYSTMWRVSWPDGLISDMVNLSRANDTCRRWNESERVRYDAEIRRSRGAGID